MGVSGYKIKAAFEIEKTREIGQAATVSDMLHVIAESIVPKTVLESLTVSSGDAPEVQLIDRSTRNSGELTLEAHYDGVTPIAAFMGHEHEVSPINKGSGAYLHYLDLDWEVATRNKSHLDKYVPSGKLCRRGTLVVDKDVEMWEYISCFVQALSIEASPRRIGFMLTLQPTLIVNNQLVNTSSSGWTLPTASKIKFQGMAVYLKPLNKFTLSTSKTLTFQESGSINVNTAIVAAGTYYGHELARAIESALRSVSDFSWSYWVAFVPDKRRFLIISEGSFQITGGTILETIGFKVHGYQSEHYSDFVALPDGLETFSSLHKVKVATLSINAARQLSFNSAVEYPLSGEPLELEPPQVTGTLEKLRYEADFLSDVSRLVGDLFSLRVEFTGELIGGSNYEKFVVDVPACKLMPVEVSVNGAEVVKQRLTFAAVMPNWSFDFRNFGEGEYFLRYVTAPGTIEAIGMYAGKLHIAVDVAGVKKLYKFEDGSFVYLADVPVQVTAMFAWAGKLWLGVASSTVYTWDGTSAVTSGILPGVTNIVDFEMYDDKLFAIDSATGDVWVYGGTSWSKSFNNLLTPQAGFALKTYENKLYAYLRRSDSKVYVYDGSTWSESLSFPSGSNQGDLLVHGGYLWAGANYTGFINLYKFDGTSWTVATGTSSNNKRRLISLRGGILFTYEGLASNGKFYYYDAGSQAETLIRDLGVNFPDARPVVVDNVVFIPSSTTKLYYYDPLQLMTLKFQNRRSTNYLQ